MTSSAPPLDIEHLRNWIDREETAVDRVSEELARKFQATLELPGEPPREGLVVPRFVHFCLTQALTPTSGLGEDGHPRRGGYLPPLPLPRRMWAGGELSFNGDLRVGDVVRRVSRIADVKAKEGRSGSLCFVTVKHELDVDGQVVVKERQDIVYRGSDSGGTKKETVAAAAGKHVRRVEPSPPFLFRYSAVTFNAHRIHYDHPYATKVEGYPGLVVHGPLQATLLFNFAAEIQGTPPSRFSFKSLSPLFDNADFFLHAERDDSGLKLWTARKDGPVAMEAEAKWA